MPKQNHDKPPHQSAADWCGGKIKCGLIGLGRWGKNYLRLLQDMPGVTLRASVSSANVSSIFSDPEIDAVFIVTPPTTHYALIEAGLKSGKYIFVEKPMVLSVSEAEKLKTLAAQSGKIFMVGFQYLFNDNINYLKTELEKGTFGKIISTKSEHFLSPLRSDVSIFWDAAPHPLSVFQYLFNPKKLITAVGKMEHDSTDIKVEFENAPALEITESYFGQTKIRKLTIKGEMATAVLDETLQKNKLAILVNGKTTYPEIAVNEPLRTEIEHFIHCVQTGETPLTDINFGCQITEWLETISKKIR